MNIEWKEDEEGDISAYMDDIYIGMICPHYMDGYYTIVIDGEIGDSFPDLDEAKENFG